MRCLFFVLLFSVGVFGQGLNNATLPLPPAMPSPGNGIPDLNGIWVMPYTTDLT